MPGTSARPRRRRHRAAAQAAPPAVHQRFPVGRLVVKGIAQVARKIGADHGGAQALGLKRADLLVDGADLRTLFIAERGAVDGTGDAVERKLGWRAGVDDGGVLVDVADANRLTVRHREETAPRRRGVSINR